MSPRPGLLPECCLWRHEVLLYPRCSFLRKYPSFPIAKRLKSTMPHASLSPKFWEDQTLLEEEPSEEEEEEWGEEEGLEEEEW